MAALQRDAPPRLVSVFLQRPIDPERKLLCPPLPREKLEAASGSFRRFLSTYEVEDEAHREITLPSGAPGGLKHVLGIIRAHGGKPELFINIVGMGVSRSVAIWEACDLLDLEPKSAMQRLMSYLCWNVSHEKITPEVMDKVHTVFRPSNAPEDKDRRRPWDSLIHQYAWDLVHDEYTLEEQTALRAVCTPHPELSEAVVKKIQQLQNKKRVHDLQQEDNEKRRQGIKPSHKINKGKRRSNDFAWREQKLQQHADEVKAGLREWRPELEPYIHKAPSYEIGTVRRRKVVEKEVEGEIDEHGWE